MSKEKVDAEQVIAKLGGNAKTAELCEVTPGAVSQWLHNGIPRAQLKFLRLARPDVFEASASTEAQPQ
jgi:predicted transcriptional regulator